MLRVEEKNKKRNKNKNEKERRDKYSEEWPTEASNTENDRSSDSEKKK